LLQTNQGQTVVNNMKSGAMAAAAA
jgi:hypothetical protein